MLIKRVGTLLLVATIFAVAVWVPFARAEGALSRTYFSGKVSGQYTFITGWGHLGTYSTFGSVMPNLIDDYSTDKYGIHPRTGNGAGAIGTIALGAGLNDGKGSAAVPGTANQELKAKFYAFLYNKYTNADACGSEICAWEKAGAALIVHQMIGKPTVYESGDVAWGDSFRTVSPDVWADLEKRLKDETLIMERRDFSNKNNTVGVTNNGASISQKYDMVDYYVDSPWPVDSWVFHYGSTASPAYVLEIECANPLGRLDGLNVPPPEEPKDYSLTPTIDTDGKTSVEPGGDVTVTGKVNNPSDNPSKGTEWRLTQIVYGPGPNPTNKSAGDSTNDPCSFFDGAGRIAPPCNAVESGTDRVFDPKKTTVVSDKHTYTVPEDAEVGTKICFALSVKPPTHEAADQDKWRHSALSCVMVSKSPKVQIWGGDLRVGGNIDVSSREYTNPDPLTFGSWGEYGALSNGSNSGFASGAGLNMGNPDRSQSSWSALTFANTGTVAPCSFGCYNFTLSSQALVEQFAAASATPLSGDIDLNALGSGTYRTTGNITLRSATVSPGKSIVILSEHTITVAGDITYSNGPYTNVRDIPQVVLRAPVINIENGAGKVDAWLLAVNSVGEGMLNTCSDVAVDASLTANICNNPLVVNGPVVADTIHLRRTAGSGGAPSERGNPAEVFNLRADAFLWGSGYGSGMGKARTVYVKELPPRF